MEVKLVGFGAGLRKPKLWARRLGSPVSASASLLGCARKALGSKPWASVSGLHGCKATSRKPKLYYGLQTLELQTQRALRVGCALFIN